MNTSTPRLSIVLSLFLITSLLASCATSPPPITAVTVRGGANQKLIKELKPSELAEFQRHWKDREQLGDAATTTKKKDFDLSITWGKDMYGHWYYASSGELRLLTIKAGIPSYRIREPKAFNKLIGATR
jgi:hypothetical protein